MSDRACGADSTIEQASIRARDVVGGAFAAFRREPVRVLVTAVLVFGVLGVLEARVDLQAGSGRNEITVVLLLAGALFAAAGSVAYPALLDRLIGDERHLHREESIGHVVRTLPYGRILGADILVTLAIVGGFVALVVPGLIIMNLFALVGPLLTSEDLGVRAAMRRSATLVRKHFWLVFGLATVPLFVEESIEEWVSRVAQGAPIVESVVIHAAFGMLVASGVGLVEVQLADRLAARYPRPADAS
ncbi:MAG: hypothetical protein ACXW2C_10495 [Acidimicrobiia bacterium]